VLTIREKLNLHISAFLPKTCHKNDGLSRDVSFEFREFFRNMPAFVDTHEETDTCAYNYGNWFLTWNSLARAS